MSTYTQIIYHIIFATKDRKPTLTKSNRDNLYKYIWGIFRGKDCHLHRIGGTDDHVHILCELKPAITLSSLVKDIKVATSRHIKEDNLFPIFTNWQEGYGAFTCSPKDRDAIINYIQNQEEHHREVTFIEEYEALLKAAGVEYDPKYL